MAVRGGGRIALLALSGALAFAPTLAAQEGAAGASGPREIGAPAALVPRPDPRLTPPPSALPAAHPAGAFQPQTLTLGQGLLYGGLVGCVGLGFLLSSGDNVQEGERGRAFVVGCAFGIPLGMIAGVALSLAP